VTIIFVSINYKNIFLMIELLSVPTQTGQSREIFKRVNSKTKSRRPGQGLKAEGRGRRPKLE